MNDNLLQLAITYHQAGKYDQAEKLYLQVLEINPDDANALHLYGILAGQQGSYEQALELIQRGIQLQPDSATFHNSMGNVLWCLERFDEAITHYQTSIALQPNAPVAQNNLGNLMLKLQRNQEAIQHYQAAIDLKPDYAEAYYNLSLALIKTGDEREAIKQLKTALNLEPVYPQARGQLAVLLQQANELEEALKHYQKRLEIEPEHVETLVNIGAILVKQGDLLQGVDYFHKALEFDPNHVEGHYNLGSTYLSLQRPDDALAHFLRGLQGQPDLDTYYNIGVIYMYKDRHLDAIDYFNSALSIDPNFVAAHINLATTYLKMDNYPKAIEHYQKTLTLDPDNPEVAFILSAISEAKNQPTTAPLSFVKNLFDQYAPYFEKHLVEHLKYQAHRLIYDALKDLLKQDLNKLVIVDLGCGTGLCGELLQPHASKLIGIDISPKMVAAAKEKKVYTDLIEGDIAAVLQDIRDVDLIVAADVFGYLGDLNDVFTAAHTALKTGGWFAFTIEQAEGKSFALTKTTRFVHSPHYIHHLAEINEFRILVENGVELRVQRQAPVLGTLFILQKTT